MMASSVSYRGRRNISVEEKFWSRVSPPSDKKACWTWLGTVASTGYGIIWIGGKSGGYEGAHRVSWIIHFERIPKGKWILHKCDNPICVNPRHLYAGTHFENNRDRRLRGRACRGELHPKSKLTASAVKFIRRRRRSQVGALTLSRKFNVSASLIWSVWYRASWKHVK